MQCTPFSRSKTVQVLSWHFDRAVCAQIRKLIHCKRYRYTWFTWFTWITWFKTWVWSLYTRFRRNWRSLANTSLEGKCETAVYNCLLLADIGQESTNLETTFWGLLTLLDLKSALLTLSVVRRVKILQIHFFSSFVLYDYGNIVIQSTLEICAR